MGASFLQSGAATRLRAVLEANQQSLDTDRSELLAFLSGTQDEGYSPQSGQILGILKQMKDEMAGDNKDAVAQEDAAVKSYKALIAAKEKEVAVTSKMIEEKLGRIADL